MKSGTRLNKLYMFWLLFIMVVMLIRTHVPMLLVLDI